MKQLLFIALLLPLFSAAQIEVKETTSYKQATVGEVKRGGYFIAELKYEVRGEDTLFMLLYRNAQYEAIVDIESVAFYNSGSTVDDLYTLFKSVFKKENQGDKNYEVALTLGDTEVILDNLKGVLRFYTRSGYFLVNEKQVDKLFGK